MIITYQGYEIVLEAFGKALNGPIVIISDTESVVSHSFEDAISIIDAITYEGL